MWLHLNEGTLPGVFVANRFVCCRPCYHVFALARRARNGEDVAGNVRAADLFHRRSGSPALAR
jgi:hypothetical protein